METSEKRSGTGGRLGEGIGYELKRAQHALRLRMDEALRETKSTTPQYAALSALAEEPGLSNAQLARRSFVTPQTMNQILKGLEAAGLVRREGHPEHGRVLRSYLTEEGEGLRGECAGRVAAVAQRMVAGLSEEERSGFLGMLRRCSAALRVEVGG